MSSLYRPTPWEESRNFWYWSPDQDLKTPSVEGVFYTNKDDAENGRPRIDLDHYNAWSNRRFWGYVAQLETSHSENTPTPFSVTVVGRVWFIED